MDIKNIIVHSLEKEQHQEAEKIKVHLKQEEFPIDVKIKGLLASINEVYLHKTGKAYGKLSPLASFSRLLKSHIIEDTNPFISLSHSSMDDLKRHISLQPLATGGYIVFTRFTSSIGKDYFMVVMLKSKDGLSFTDELELMEAHQLDLDKLHFAARVDLDLWKEEDEGTYVSFIKGRSSSSVTLYFREFLGIEEFSESVAITKKLIQAITNYYRVHLNNSDDHVENYKRRVHDYCKDKSENGETIYLDELSRFLDEENPSDFLSFAQNNHEIPNEFSVDASTLRKLIKYSGKDKDLSISFSASVFGSRIKYDSTNDTLIIRHIPPLLKAQLIKGEINQPPSPESNEP